MLSIIALIWYILTGNEAINYYSTVMESRISPKDV